MPLEGSALPLVYEQGALPLRGRVAGSFRHAPYPPRYYTPTLLFLSVLHDAATKKLGYRQAQERHTLFTRKRLLAKASPTHA